MTKLNGWQRLWIVGCVVWTCVSLFSALKDFPTAASYRAIWKRFADADVPEIQRQRTALLRCNEEGGAGAASKCLIQFPPVSRVDQDRYDSVLQKGEDSIRTELASQQFTFAWVFCAYWLIPCLLVYGIGMVVSWVVRGFRK